MKKALIVTPNWPPVSCPDLHRVRMALPYFRQYGWEPLILKINPDEQEGIKDPELWRTVSLTVKTWQARCVPLGLTKWFGLRNIGMRSYLHLAHLGDRIIRQESPAVVFFSTTMFPLMTLGRLWHRHHRVPYVLDFQDPWHSGRHGTVRGGGNLKGHFANWMAARLEPFSLRRAAHIVSVSPAYPRALASHYPWLRSDQFTVLPFGAPERDFEFLRSSHIRQAAFDPSDGKKHWVYVGRGGPDMAVSLRAFFLSLAVVLNRHPGMRDRLRVHFIGTAYAPPDRAVKTVEPLGKIVGVNDVVCEVTERIPYFEALQCLLEADALFMPGSEDTGYTASKLYPYILAKKPLLAVFHEQSSVAEILKNTNAGTIVTFRSGETPESISQRIVATGWLERPEVPRTDWHAFEPYTAEAMTQRLCQVFAAASAQRDSHLGPTP